MYFVATDFNPLHVCTIDIMAKCLFVSDMPSTVIAEMNYDPVDETLRIKFVSGLIYEYLKVPEEIYLAMKTSGAKGIYLNKHIKGKFEFKLVSPR